MKRFNITKIEEYKTSDGMSFKSLGEAERHQNYLCFYEGYCDGNQVTSPSYEVSAARMYDWLMHNKRLVLEALEEDMIDHELLSMSVDYAGPGPR